MTEETSDDAEVVLFVSDKQEETILMIESRLNELCLVTREETNIALIDSACPTTVAGIEWVKNFIASMPEPKKQMIKMEDSSRVYKFGGGERRQSRGTVILPCTLDDKLDVAIKVEMIEADLPLLLGNTTLKKGLAVLHIGDSKLELLGKMLDIKETKSGHYSVMIKPAQCQNTTMVEDAVCLAMNIVEELDEKEVRKLHHYWGHCRVEKLGTLIERAGRMTGAVKEHLKNVKETCESCRVNKNRQPKQVVAMPRATRRNQIVTVDLKEWEDGRHILYIIDMFTRFTVGAFIKDKKAETISEAILNKWISIFGSMEVLHKDG